VARAGDASRSIANTPQDADQVVSVVLAEVVGEELADRPSHDGKGGCQPLPPGVGQNHMQAPPVAGYGLARHQAGCLYPIYGPGQPAATQENGLGQLVHPKAPVRSFRQLKEHVVPGEGKSQAGLEPAFHPGDDQRVRVQEGPPGREAQVHAPGPPQRHSIG